MTHGLLQYKQKYEAYANAEQTLIDERLNKGKLIEICTQCNNVREISHLIDDTFSLVLIRALLS